MNYNHFLTPCQYIFKIKKGRINISVYTPCVITFILEISEPGYPCIYRFPYAVLIIICLIFCPVRSISIVVQLITALEIHDKGRSFLFPSSSSKPPALMMCALSFFHSFQMARAYFHTLIQFSFAIICSDQKLHDTVPLPLFIHHHDKVQPLSA